MASQVVERDICSNLSTVFMKLQNVATTQIGYELFKRLVYKNVSNEHNVQFIMDNIASQLSALPLNNTREPFIKLVTLIFQNNLNVK